MLTCVSYLNTLYISFLYICRTVNVDTDQIFKITFLKIIQLKNIQLKIIQFMAILMNYTDHIKIIFAKTSFDFCCLLSFFTIYGTISILYES